MGGVKSRLVLFRMHTVILSPLVWPIVRTMVTLDIMAARLPVVVLGLLLPRPPSIVMVFRPVLTYVVETLDSR